MVGSTRTVVPGIQVQIAVPEKWIAIFITNRHELYTGTVSTDTPHGESHIPGPMPTRRISEEDRSQVV